MSKENVSKNVVKIVKGILRGVALMGVAEIMINESKKCNAGYYSRYNNRSHDRRHDYRYNYNRDRNCSYDEAVEAIMDSDMYSFDKQESCTEIPLCHTSEFYKAIVHIAESDMYSFDKRDAIHTMCAQKDES